MIWLFKKKNISKLTNINLSFDFKNLFAFYIYKVYLNNRIIRKFYKSKKIFGSYFNKLIYIDIVNFKFIKINNTKYFIYFYYNKIKKIKIYFI
jgi:hypothetical protein